ncbi:MAG: hypothetical protein IMW98_08530 [Firmicutes bacterium]|nr:hypothetical protein [Bacillota bacterium]MBE3590851.1 hypothetical protein [Bacillota bacterium]
MSLYVSLADRLRSLEPRLRDQAYRLGALDELRTLADEVEAMQRVVEAAKAVADAWEGLLETKRIWVDPSLRARIEVLVRTLEEAERNG